MNKQPVDYGVDTKGNIVLPEGPPFDGKPVLIRLAAGWVEAWWHYGQATEDHEGNKDWDGWCWVCLDDRFQAELDEAREWTSLP